MNRPPESLFFLISSVAIFTLAVSCVSQPRHFDILITGGTVYDGTGDTPVLADVGVEGDRIVFVGETKKNWTADKTVDASGCVVCPGFIDPHTHLEATLADKKAAEHYLRMGVTTVITGQCGGSQYPLSDYFSKLEEQGIGPNTASFSGHNSLRRKVMKEVDKRAGVPELNKMKDLFAKDLEAGSLGLSSGLFYVPGCFADISEVIELCKEMAPEGGIYTTHIRHENKDGIGLYASVLEALAIGKAAEVPVNISHIKCAGKTVWNQSDKVIAAIEAARAEGQEVTADQYPYLASNTAMASALTPAWSRDGGLKGLRRKLSMPFEMERLKPEMEDLINERGGAETILVLDSCIRTLAVISEQMGLAPVDAVIEILKESNPRVNTFTMCDYDVENFMRKPWVMTSSDGFAPGTHPRSCGTFAEKIQTYVVGKKVISIDEMIRKSTGLVADTYKLTDRGYIKDGAFADIIVFKIEEVKAKANYETPDLLSEGFRFVAVNGNPVVENDMYNGSLPGKVLRRSRKKWQE